MGQGTPVRSAAVPPARDKAEAYSIGTATKSKKNKQQRLPGLKFANFQPLGNDVAFIAW